MFLNSFCEEYLTAGLDRQPQTPPGTQADLILLGCMDPSISSFSALPQPEGVSPDLIEPR
jgi:hypothetical protein